MHTERVDSRYYVLEGRAVQDVAHRERPEGPEYRRAGRDGCRGRRRRGGPPAGGRQGVTAPPRQRPQKAVERRRHGGTLRRRGRRQGRERRRGAERGTTQLKWRRFSGVGHGLRHHEILGRIRRGIRRECHAPGIGRGIDREVRPDRERDLRGPAAARGERIGTRRTVAAARGDRGDEHPCQLYQRPTGHPSLPGPRAYSPTFIRSCTVRGRPSDAPLKNAPFSRYFLSNTLSMYTWGRTTVPPNAKVYPTLPFRMKFGPTWCSLLKSSRPVPCGELVLSSVIRPDP